MMQEFGRLRCRVCGDQVVVPLSPLEKKWRSQRPRIRANMLERAYRYIRRVESRNDPSKPPTALKMRRAIAGIG